MQRIRLIATFIAMAMLTTGLALSVPDVAHAQNADTITVSPPVDEQNANPGQTLERKITVSNITSRDRMFVTTAKNAVPTGDTGAPDLVPDEGPYSLSAWVTVEPNKIAIKAGESQEFQVTIKVPDDAGPGSHSGAVVFSPSGEDANAGGSVSVVAEVSALLLVNVSGDQRVDTKLDSFSPSKSIFLRSTPVTFAAVFKNNGNLVSRPEGTVTIKNVFGKKVETLTIEPQRVLPTGQRKFEVTWKNAHLIGPYSAQLSWHAGSVSAEATTVRLWGVPLKAVVPVVIGLLLAFFLLWLPRKRLKKAFIAFKNA